MSEPFTSDLSASEYLLVEDAGFEPLGLVVGVAVYHVGFREQFASNGELTVLGNAMYKARELAMDSLEGEASRLRADGVVGVRLETGRQGWGSQLMEFMVAGTAVRHRGGRKFRTKNGRAFTSDLSGQEFRTLLNSGYRPAALVMGYCVYHVGRRGVGQAVKQVRQNAEMVNFTQAMYDAREHAIARMQTEAQRCHADGVVGMRIQENHHRWGAHTIEFSAIGTAVVALPDAGGIRPPLTVLPLDDQRSR